jgi:transcriptional regulator with XRE-family HTH domain
MKTRLQQIMEREGLSPSKFAASIGIKRSAMSHYMTGRNDPGVDVLRKIYDKYPYVNLDWLLTGSGSMTKGIETGEQKRHETPPYLPKQLGIFTDSEPTANPALPVIPPQSVPPPEYRKETRIITSRNMSKKTSAEQLMILQKNDTRSVAKIVLFYSDDTFETFIPERLKKDKG